MIFFKDRRVKEIVETYAPDAIIRAAIRVLKDQGHSNASKALDLIHKDPDELNTVHLFIDSVKKEKIPSLISVPRALAHKLDIGLSSRQYDKTAALGNPECLDQIIWPSGNQLKKESKELRPEVIYDNYVPQ